MTERSQKLKSTSSSQLLGVGCMILGVRDYYSKSGSNENTKLI